jgi:hypothetical protein
MGIGCGIGKSPPMHLIHYKRVMTNLNKVGICQIPLVKSLKLNDLRVIRDRILMGCIDGNKSITLLNTILSFYPPPLSPIPFTLSLSINLYKTKEKHGVGIGIGCPTPSIPNTSVFAGNTLYL